MEWQFDSNAPIYLQLVERITLRIAVGDYPPGTRLPPVRELAMEAGVNPNTMQRALGELERDGLVYAQRTSGRFVTEDTERIRQARNELAEQRVQTFLRSMRELGCTPEEIRALVAQTREKEESI